MEKIKIKKTRIVKRSGDYVLDAVLIDRGKTIKDKLLRKQEQALYNAYFTERQSMKRAHARRKWKLFVMKHSK